MASQNGRRPEFLSLLNSLHPKASKWELLGVAFGLNMDALAIIRANSMEVEVRLKRVLDEVYKTQPELTWKDVIEVLKQPVVSEDVLAQQLEDQLTALKVEKTEGRDFVLLFLFVCVCVCLLLSCYFVCYSYVLELYTVRTLCNWVVT